MANEEMNTLQLEELENIAGGLPLGLADDAKRELANLKASGLARPEAIQQLIKNSTTNIFSGLAEDLFPILMNIFRSQLAAPLADSPAELKSPLISKLYALIDKEWDEL